MENMLQNSDLTAVYPGVTLLSGASVGEDDDGNACIVFTSDGAGAMGMQRAIFALDAERFPNGTEVGKAYRVPVEVLSLSGGPLQLYAGAETPAILDAVGPVDYDFTAASSVSAVRVMHNGSGPIQARFRVGGLFD